LLHAFRRNADGATAVEFAFLAPVFFGMLGMLFETGVMMFVEYSLQASVQEAARTVRTGQAYAGKWTRADFKKEVCSISKIVIDCDNKVVVHMEAAANFATLASDVPDYLSIGPKLAPTDPPPPYECGLPNEMVALIATYDWEFSMLGMSAFANLSGTSTRRLVAFAMFKNEPFPSVAGNGCVSGA
jgi:hypothetical protein